MNTIKLQGWLGRGISQLSLLMVWKIPEEPYLKTLINSLYLMAVQRHIIWFFLMGNLPCHE